MSEFLTNASVDAPFDAVFFDGVVSRRRLVTLRFGAAGLDIASEGETRALWPYDEIRRVGSPGFVLRREAQGAPTYARLELRNQRLWDEALAHCRFIHGLGRESPGSRRRIVAWSLAATASVAALISFGVPLAADRIAPLVPAAFERRLGESVDTQVRAMFARKACGGETGVAALFEMSWRLQEAARLESTATIEVLDTKVPNALALPGGKIYVFSGLLEKAQSPDEVAGVIAHELGHLVHRDALRRLIAMGGTSYLFGLLYGDVTGAGALIFATKALMGAAHSREQEAQADQFAAELLARLGRPARPSGELLMRIAGSEDATLALLHDHPLTAERLAAFNVADQGEAGPPLLDPQQWAALKAICD